MNIEPQEQVAVLQAENAKLRKALEDIMNVKPSHSEQGMNFRYNKCWHIAYDALGYGPSDAKQTES